MTPGGRLIRSALVRTAWFAAAWLVLTEGSTGGWLLAVLTVASATAVSLHVRPAGASFLRPLGLARFLWYFGRASLAGGIDVARRAFARRPRVDGYFFEVRLRLPPGPARPFLAATTGLLPGTVAAELDDDRLLVHALASDIGGPDTVRELEQRVGDLFGARLERR